MLQKLGCPLFIAKNTSLKKRGEVIISALNIADFVNMIRSEVLCRLLFTFNMTTTVLITMIWDKISSNKVLLIVASLSGYALNMEGIQAFE